MATILVTNLFGHNDSNSELLPGHSGGVIPVELALEKEISLKEVSWHDTAKDCWIVVYDRVYDVTEFLYQHPGGEDVLLEYAGRDATIAFRGTGHSLEAVKALDKYFIGSLPMHERIFRKADGFCLSDMPL